MMTSAKNWTQRLVALIALALLGGLVGLLAPASAGAATDLGGLTVSPATGTAVDPIRLSTVSSGAAKGCPSPATSVVGFVTGPGGWVNILGVQATDLGVSNSADFGVELSDTFTGLAASNGLTVLAGKYTLTVRCTDDLNGDFGEFTGSLWFTSANAFQNTDPAAPAVTATTTNLAVTPAGTAVAGAPVALTATVSPSAAVGSVQFTDTVGGATVNVGSPVAVVAGVASVNTTTLAQGDHALKATFTPTSTAYTGSSSSTVSYTVTAPPSPATPTTTTIGATPAAGAVAGAPVTLTASLAPVAAAGTVQFVDTVGGVTSPVGSQVTVSAGSASLTTTSLTATTHSLKAVFTPSDAAAYAASTSDVLTYSVTAPANPPTTTAATLAVTPASGASAGDPVSLTATITPAGAAGTVLFTDGGTAIAPPVAVSAGTASTSTTSLATGSRSLQAVFTPADAGAYTAATTSVLSYLVSPKSGPTATTLTLSAAPAGGSVAGAAVTFTATVSPSAAAGTVSFTSTSAGGTATAIGSPAPVTGGTASVTSSSLPVGSVSIEASFAPADAAAFQASVAPALSYSVTSPPTSPASTATVLAAPSGPVKVGVDVSLSASVSPAGASGTVQFTDTLAGTTSPLGSPVPVSGGTATLTTRFTAAGAHSVQAQFTPSDPAAFRSSTSEVAAYQVEPSENPGASATSVRLSVWRTPWCPKASRKVIAPEGDGLGWQARRCSGAVMIAQVKPGQAAGSIQFTNTVDGVTYPAGDPVPAWNGWAVLFVEVPKGQNLGGATFVPADPAAYAPSTSNQVPVFGGRR